MIKIVKQLTHLEGFYSKDRPQIFFFFQGWLRTRCILLCWMILMMTDQWFVSTVNWSARAMLTVQVAGMLIYSMQKKNLKSLWNTNYKVNRRCVMSQIYLSLLWSLQIGRRICILNNNCRVVIANMDNSDASCFWGILM